MADCHVGGDDWMMSMALDTKPWSGTALVLCRDCIFGGLGLGFIGLGLRKIGDFWGRERGNWREGTVEDFK